MKNDDKMILNVLDIKHKNECKKLVRSESRIFHDLSQMSKWSETRYHKEIGPLSCDSNNLITPWLLFHKLNQFTKSIMTKLKYKQLNYTC